MTVDDILEGLMAREGDYVNDPTDRGGPTKFGITAATLGNWRGWPRAATTAEIMALTRVEAKAIYIARYIEQPGFTPANVPDEALRVALIDDGVNSGPAAAVQRLQRILSVRPDGIFGPKTIAALRAVKPGWVRTELVKARCLFYAEIVVRDDSQKKFLVGWMTRALSFL